MKLAAAYRILSSVSALAVVGCGEMTTSTIPPRELPALSADRPGMRSVWTTDGRVVDVAEPFAVVVRIDRRTATTATLPEEVVLEGPLLARIDESVLTLQECQRAALAGGEACRPHRDELRAPLAALSEVSVVTQVQKDDPRAGPSRGARPVLHALLVVGGLASFAAFSYGLYALSEVESPRLGPR
jgi:hypothetical protein